MKSFDKSKLLDKTNKELEVYINEPYKFQPEAVSTAIHLLKERGYNFTQDDLDCLALKQKANQKINIILGKEYFLASNLIFLLFAVSKVFERSEIFYPFIIYSHRVGTFFNCIF